MVELRNVWAHNALTRDALTLLHMGFGASLSVLAIFKVLNEAFIFSVKSRRVCLSGVTISG
jgi:hypothetical protein